MVNDNIIKEIFFFGSLKDGFKCYPDTDRYSHYYNNSKSDWILSIRKYNGNVIYTYVKYGLITSISNGRKGSCFGISITLNNYMFNDINLLIVDFFEKGIIKTMLREGELIRQISNSQITFIPYNFSEKSTYLDNWAKKIKIVICEKLKKELIPLDVKIPNTNSNVIGLNILSNPKVLHEYFSYYGGINISNSYPIENMSIDKKRVEDNNALIQNKIDNQNRLILKFKEEIIFNETIIRERDAEILNLKAIINSLNKFKGGKKTIRVPLVIKVLLRTPIFLIIIVIIIAILITFSFLKFE